MPRYISNLWLMLPGTTGISIGFAFAAETTRKTQVAFTWDRYFSGLISLQLRILWPLQADCSFLFSLSLQVVYIFTVLMNKLKLEPFLLFTPNVYLITAQNKWTETDSVDTTKPKRWLQLARLLAPASRWFAFLCLAFFFSWDPTEVHALIIWFLCMSHLCYATFYAFLYCCCSLFTHVSMSHALVATFRLLPELCDTSL